MTRHLQMWNLRTLDDTLPHSRYHRHRWNVVECPLVVECGWWWLSVVVGESSTPSMTSYNHHPHQPQHQRQRHHIIQSHPHPHPHPNDPSSAPSTASTTSSSLSSSPTLPQNHYNQHYQHYHHHHHLHHPTVSFQIHSIILYIISINQIGK